MLHELTSTREKHFEIIDSYGKMLAENFLNRASITVEMIEAIISFYDTASIEKNFNTLDFSSAYQAPVTADFEFLLARLIYHIGLLNNKGWKVDLRRQSKKATPDIRISRNDQSLCILELKVGMSWIRSFICPTFYRKAKLKYSKDNKWDPDAFNQELCKVLNKYEEVYSVTKEHIYFVVPSLYSIHYKKDSKHLSISDYRNHFSMVSGISQNNLVIFNESLTQKLEKGTTPPFSPTRDLENMITKILKL